MLRLFLHFRISYLNFMNIKDIALHIFHCCPYVAIYRKYIC